MQYSYFQGAAGKDARGDAQRRGLIVVSGFPTVRPNPVPLPERENARLALEPRRKTNEPPLSQ
nr:MAG TPA: hypothetical protein [Caudoviricetes sp.]